MTIDDDGIIEVEEIGEEEIQERQKRKQAREIRRKKFLSYTKAESFNDNLDFSV